MYTLSFLNLIGFRLGLCVDVGIFDPVMIDLFLGNKRKLVTPSMKDKTIEIAEIWKRVWMKREGLRM